jgi:aldehyde dehydrogenase (NAD+)
MDQITFEDPVMQEEIFGPVLPILTFDCLKTAVKKLQTLPHPLAFYLFSRNRNNIKCVLDHCQFGGGCINDTIVHLATSNMGFGGVGSSGMGAYHGKRGFDTFTHYRSIVSKNNRIDLPMRYQPYKKQNDKLLHMFLQ